MVYHDNWNPYFFMWLADRPYHDQAVWIYDHRDQMDDARYNSLVAQNAQLAAELRTLEAQQAPKDPNYVPAGVDQDLMYNNDYAAAHTGSQVPWGKIFLWVFGIAFACIIVWAVFFRETEY